MMDIFQSLGAYWPGVKILAGELIEVRTWIYYINIRIFLIFKKKKNNNEIKQKIFDQNNKQY